MQEDKPTHKAAFLVLVTHEGEFVFEPDINSPITVERSPSPSEIKGALFAISEQIKTQEMAVLTTQLVLSNLQMQAQQAFNAQQNQQVLQKIGMNR